MSSHGGHGGGAWDHLKWVVYILIILWFVWFFTGGPERYEKSQKGAFIKPLTDTETPGKVYGPQ